MNAELLLIEFEKALELFTVLTSYIASLSLNRTNIKSAAILFTAHILKFAVLLSEEMTVES